MNGSVVLAVAVGCTLTVLCPKTQPLYVCVGGEDRVLETETETRENEKEMKSKKKNKEKRNA